MIWRENEYRPVPRSWHMWFEDDGIEELLWPMGAQYGDLRGTVRSPINGVDTELLIHAVNVARSVFPVCRMDRLLPAVLLSPASDFDVLRSRWWRPFATERMIDLATGVWRPYLESVRANVAAGFVWPNTTSHHRAVLEQVWPPALTRRGWIRAWPLGVEEALYVKSPVEGVEVEEFVAAARATANRRFTFRAALSELLDAVVSAGSRDEVDDLLETHRVLQALRG